MDGEIMAYDATLWHGGEALVAGTFSDCIGRWQRLPVGPRTHAYIQVRGPLGAKNIFHPRDLNGFALRPVEER